MANENIKIIEVAYHRNGICGVPFYAVRFNADIDGTPRRMVAIRFEEESYINPRVAVLDVDILSDVGVAFGANSWRGDHFSTIVEDAISRYNDDR